MKSDSTMREIEEFVDAIPPAHPGLRARVMQSLPPDTRPERASGLMTAAAVLLAILVVATLVAGIRNLPNAVRPAGVPAVTPGTAGVASLPERTPVIPFVDESGGPRVEAVTWSGGQPEILGVPARPYASPDGVSPDGSRFLVSTIVSDRQGASVGDVAGAIAWRWADDSRHLCGMRFPGTTTVVEGPANLVVTQPGQGIRDVAQVGRLQGESMAHLLACSFATDTAVVVQETSSAYVTEVWTVRLSTGAILTHHAYPKGSAVDLVSASADGTLLVEWRPAIPAGSAPVTGTILRAADRTVLGTVHGWVEAFSSDDQLAVVASGLGNTVSVVRWQTGETLWTAPAAQRVGPVLAEPGGSRVAVWVTASAGGPMDLWIIGPIRARKVLTGVEGLA